MNFFFARSFSRRKADLDAEIQAHLRMDIQDHMQPRTVL